MQMLLQIWSLITGIAATAAVVAGPYMGFKGAPWSTVLWLACVFVILTPLVHPAGFGAFVPTPGAKGGIINLIVLQAIGMTFAAAVLFGVGRLMGFVFA